MIDFIHTGEYGQDENAAGNVTPEEHTSSHLKVCNIADKYKVEGLFHAALTSIEELLEETCFGGDYGRLARFISLCQNISNGNELVGRTLCSHYILRGRIPALQDSQVQDAIKNFPGMLDFLVGELYRQHWHLLEASP